MNRLYMVIFIVVCALWNCGGILTCDQCGRECAPACGTRQFRACCYNNLRKRAPNLGFKLWLVPPENSEHFKFDYDS
ncbi:GSCOCG00004127001-RA-CDS [Cotesia congregata]|uniref:Trissin n=1 Tax=Cotesia glomerata TaxID=32391 RepID=A0AAV7J479_COTGL|nr:hypothetical protein KQX54_011340 [Cotesia glomerata]CAD6214585.1 GSCOCG00004127001-RA-CDS [Cotesia congregata]